MSKRLSVLFLLAALPLHAQSQRPGDSDVRPLIEEALSKNPEIRAAERSHDAAHARIPQMGALPDPTVTLTYQNADVRPTLGADENTFLGVTVEQGVPFPGKRRLATRIAGVMAAHGAHPVDRARLSVEAEVRRAYADLLLSRELLAILSEQEATWAQIEAATRARYAVGMGGQPDVLRAQAERTRLGPMRAHETGNAEAALAALNRALARPAGQDVPTPRRVPEVVGEDPRVPTLEELVALAEEKSPEIGSARLAVEKARLDLDLARRNRLPDFIASAAYMNRGSLPPMLSIGVGVTVPLYAKRKQEPAIAEADARLGAAEADLAATRLAVRLDLEKNLAEYRAAVREAVPYAKGVLVQDSLAVDSTLASYETGRVPFVSVLEAMGALFGDRKEYAERLAHVLWHDASLYKLMPAERIAPSAWAGM